MRPPHTPLAVACLLVNAFFWGISWWPFQQLERMGLHPLWATAIVYGLIFVLIALAAGGGVLLHARLARTLSAGLVFALSLAGAASALWQHFVAAASSSCKRTLADRIVSGLQLDALAPEIFAPRASCADAAVDLLGLPYEFWSLALFAATAIVALGLMLASLRPHQG